MTEQEELQEEQKREPDNIDYLKMALALYGIAVDRMTAELIIETHEAICKKGGAFNIKDSVELEWRIRLKHRLKSQK